MSSADRPVEKLALRVGEAAAMLSISRSQCYELIQAGKLPALKIGASWRIPVGRLREWVEAQTRERIA